VHPAQSRENERRKSRVGTSSHVIVNEFTVFKEGCITLFEDPRLVTPVALRPLPLRSQYHLLSCKLAGTTVGAVASALRMVPRASSLTPPTTGM
jgi:hypothetical protein